MALCRHPCATSTMDTVWAPVPPSKHPTPAHSPPVSPRCFPWWQQFPRAALQHPVLPAGSCRRTPPVVPALARKADTPYPEDEAPQHSPISLPLTFLRVLCQKCHVTWQSKAQTKHGSRQSTAPGHLLLLDQHLEGSGCPVGAAVMGQGA